MTRQFDKYCQEQEMEALEAEPAELEFAKAVEEDKRRKFYRYDGYEKLELDEYYVVKETRCGVWVSNGWEGSKPKLVLNGTYKKFAYETIEEARDSYIRRKKWHIKHLLRQMERAKQGLMHAENGWFDDKSRWQEEWMNNIGLERWKLLDWNEKEKRG